MLVIKQLKVAIDFHREEKDYGSQWLMSSTVWLPTFFKKSFFCVQQKKEAHFG